MIHLDLQGHRAFASPFTERKHNPAKVKKQRRRGKKWGSDRRMKETSTCIEARSRTAGLWITHRLFASSIAYGNQNIAHGSRDEVKNPRAEPAVYVSCSLYPPGEWGAAKSFIPQHTRCRQCPGSWLTLTDSCCAFGSGALLFFPFSIVWVYALFSHYASVMFPARTPSYMVAAWGVCRHANLVYHYYYLVILQTTLLEFQREKRLAFLLHFHTDKSLSFKKKSKL